MNHNLQSNPTQFAINDSMSSQSEGCPGGISVDPRQPMTLKTFFGTRLFFEIMLKAAIWGSLISPAVSFVLSGGFNHPGQVLMDWYKNWQMVAWIIPAVGMIWAFFLSSAGVLFRFAMIPRLDAWKAVIPPALSVSFFGFLFGFGAMVCIFSVSYYGLHVQTFGQGAALSEAGIAGLIAIGVGQILFSHYLNEVRVWEIWLREQELARHKLEGELMNLNMRIRPHFFFNAINTLAALIDQDREKSQEFLADLSDLFRKSFMHGQNSSWCSWKEERDLLEGYLHIEKSRFGDRLDYHLVGGMPDEILFPAFLMQPLVENAVKYGLASEMEKVLIEIRAERVDSFWQVSIINPLKSGSTIEITRGHSLHSIQERMKLLGGQMQVQIKNDQAIISLSGPLKSLEGFK